MKTQGKTQDSEAEGKQKLMLALGGVGLLIALAILGVELGFTHHEPPSPYDSKAGIEQQIRQTEASSMSPQAKQMTIMSLRKIESGMDSQAAGNGSGGPQPK